MFTDFTDSVCIVIMSGVITRLLELIFKELWFGKFSHLQNRCFNKQTLMPLSSAVIIYKLEKMLTFKNVNIDKSENDVIDLWNFVIIFIVFAIIHLAYRKVVFYTSKRNQTLALDFNFIEADLSNVGRAAAINYVENYLDYVIPCLPSGGHVAAHKGLNQRISIFERMKNFEPANQPSYDSTPEKQFVKVFRKFFVLIPKSGYVDYGTLSDADNYISLVGNLDAVKLTQGTVQNREYINNVYCINGELKRCFVAEFATPLISIFEMGNSKDKDNRDITVFQTKIFYNGLLDYLKTQKLTYDCLVEKIYYDDNAHSHSLSQVLLKCLNKVEFEPR